MKKIKKYLINIIFLAISSVALGLALVHFISYDSYFIYSITLLFATYLHLIIHEAGHLVGGLISGYTFVSFRIVNFTIIRCKNGKLLRKKFSIAGTAGQCLMSPPNATLPDYKYPLALYNLSGGVANLLFSVLFVPIALVSSGLIAATIWTFVGVGIYLALVNLIPLKFVGIDNDGSNLFTCSKSAIARRTFWVQLKVIDQLTQGIPISEMPPEWFEPPAMPLCHISGAVAGIRLSYLLDKGEFEQSKNYAQQVLDSPGKTLEIHKNELLCELLFLELIDQCRPEEIKRLYTKEVQSHIKALSTHLSKRRIIYAYQKLFTKDEKKTKRALSDFEKTCETTPYLGEIISERKLVDLVNELSKSNR